MLIYSYNITSRIKYIFKFLFTDILDIKVDFTKDAKDFINYTGPKINYSASKFKDEIVIFPHELLFETGIKKQEIHVSEWKGIKIFFQTEETSSMPFDIFAASFYLVSRYEEYLPYKGDKHGRFEASESIALINNFIDIPIVDEWVCILAGILKNRHNNIKFPEKKFRFISTIDVDNVYQFLHKGFFKNTKSFTREFLTLKFRSLKDRYNVLKYKEKDPYDTFDYIERIHKKYDLEPVCFFLIGDLCVYDRNIPFSNTSYRKLVKRIAESSGIGIHPSYKTGKEYDLLQKEVTELSSVTNNQIYKSRQHYLRLFVPQTYRNLIKAGIREDYSLGFASLPGFRAGTCTPFVFYDLEIEKQSNLTIIPFQVMDGTLNYYMRLNPDQALVHIKNIIARIKKVNGTFVSIWHNESLSDTEIWKDWKYVFEKMLEMSQNI